MRKELLTRSPIVALPEEVWKRTGALNTWGTNAIEGNTLTQRDVETLLLEDRSVGNRPLSDVRETIQHGESFRGLPNRVPAPIRMGTALELHEEVFRGIYPDAGTWRRITVFIRGSRHTPPRPEAVISSMTAWEREYHQRDVEGEPVFGLAAWMHHRFESIHPFRDGNGRVGRLLLNLHFLRHSWPPLHVLPPDRNRYLDALEAGHTGDLVQLAEFLREAMSRSLLDLLDQIGTIRDELRPLADFEDGGPYSAKYLALRSGQGNLPAVMRRGRYHTSERALGLYREEVGRS
ncbi:MAG: Fic family protein [Thermoplasmata archaeon]